MATATDDNAEIRNLDARLFEKSTCWHTRACLKNHSRDLHALVNHKKMLVSVYKMKI